MAWATPRYHDLTKKILVTFPFICKYDDFRAQRWKSHSKIKYSISKLYSIICKKINVTLVAIFRLPGIAELLVLVFSVSLYYPIIAG